MGGKAIKNCEIRRFSKKEYETICVDVRQKLSMFFSRIEPVVAYKNKQDFGDLDILVVSDNVNIDIIKMLQTVFDSKEIVPNGKVYSFEYQQFQVDLILTPGSEFWFAYHYYAYNDLGNLMGRVAHKFGLKYGHDGLYYMFRDGDYLVDELCVSMDIRKVFEVLDFNYSQWVKGFNDLEDIFNFVSQSKYFNPDIYLFDQMNHRSRVRDQKRSTYNAFLKYCDQMRGMEWEDRVFFKYDVPKSEYLPFLFESFPGFREQWFKTYHKMLEHRELKSRFNGNKICELTGLTGKGLGTFIQMFKSRFKTLEDFNLWVITTPVSRIDEKIVKMFDKWEG